MGFKPVIKLKSIKGVYKRVLTEQNSKLDINMTDIDI